MVDYEQSELFTKDFIDKQLRISTDDEAIVITNSELHSEKFELNESLCSESTLRFGCCESSSVKFKIHNIFATLKDEWLDIAETLEGADAPFPIGRYKVFSDKPTADRRYRDIVAYDAMYDIVNTDVAEWYNTVLPDKTSTMTMKEFRTSFISYFGLEQEEIELINDGMVVEKTIEPSEISGKDIATAICEINGCFGHINRNGKFQYVLLPKNIQGLYPRDDLYPSDDLFPKDSDTTRIGKGLYISCQYEDFITKGINKLQIRQEEIDIGVIVGNGDNCYIIEDNFLVYGKSSKEMAAIANNVLSVISDVTYRPFEAEAKGNFCLEVGDPIRLPTKYEIVESYILKRTIKGIQALRDSYEAEGEEYYSEKVNSVHKSILQLKGKSNVLERTIEETKSTITDVERGLKSEISQTASAIRMEVSNTEEGLRSEITQTAEGIRTEVSNTEKGLKSEISQTADSIRTEVSQTYETKTDAGETSEYLLSEIIQTASEIRTEVSATYETKTQASKTRTELQSSITQTASEIRSEVSATYETKTDAGETADYLLSEIIQTAEKIETRVSKGDVSSEISQEAGEINIRANRLGIESDNFGLEHDGTIWAAKGTVGGFEITENGFGTVEDIISIHRQWDWALRVGDLATGRDQDDQYLFCIGHEGRMYCEYVGCYGDMLVTGELYREMSSYSTSDRDWKNSIKTLDRKETADFVYSLMPVEYRYNKEGENGKLHHGLIAQDVREAMHGKDWALYTENIDKRSGKTKRSLSYEELIGDLIATIQEQNERIKVLESRIGGFEKCRKFITGLIGRITQVIKRLLTNRT